MHASDLTAGLRRRLNRVGTQGPPGPPASSATINGVAAGGALGGTYPNPAIGNGQAGPDNLQVLPAASLSLSGAQSVGSSATNLTDVANWTEAVDTANMHDPVSNTERLTAPRAGIYLVSGVVEWNVNGTGGRRLDLRVLRGGPPFTLLTRSMLDGQDDAGTVHALTALLTLNAGDAVKLSVLQDSNASRNIVAGVFSMHYVGRAS